jgi:hypothetical protein
MLAVLVSYHRRRFAQGEGKEVDLNIMGRVSENACRQRAKRSPDDDVGFTILEQFFTSHP